MGASRLCGCMPLRPPPPRPSACVHAGDAFRIYNSLRSPMRTLAMRYLCTHPLFMAFCTRRLDRGFSEKSSKSSKVRVSSVSMGMLPASRKRVQGVYASVCVCVCACVCLCCVCVYAVFDKKQMCHWVCLIKALSPCVTVQF